jgi:hypothetical protein
MSIENIKALPTAVNIENLIQHSMAFIFISRNFQQLQKYYTLFRQFQA